MIMYLYTLHDDILCFHYLIPYRTRDIYADMLDNADEFDWSGYSPNHPVFNGMSAVDVAALQKCKKCWAK